MKNRNQLRRLGLNFMVGIQKGLLRTRKGLRSLGKRARPFLAPRFWPIYLAAFGIGFYLWGPFHGFQTIKAWQWRLSGDKVKNPTVEALQNEINQLRSELQKERLPKQVPEFTPDNFSRPALGPVIRGYEWNLNGGSWRLHPGVDIELTAGSHVVAAAGGKVTTVRAEVDGFTVRISHGNGWESVYNHLQTVVVQPNQEIIKGGLIGLSGGPVCDGETTGIHFSLYLHGQAQNPQKIMSDLME